MNIYTIAIFTLVFMAGILCNLLLFRQDKKVTKNRKFITSERLLVFIIEIFIAVIGFGVTLGVTNDNERSIEKEQAISMLSQAVEYTEKQINEDNGYRSMCKKGTMDKEKLKSTAVINLDYYTNILSNEAVLKYSNMNTYGTIMKYLKWIENNEAALDAETDPDEVYQKIVNRVYYLEKFNELITVCINELEGDITAEEASAECKSIRAK